jgi:hypothetical protein
MLSRFGQILDHKEMAWLDVMHFDDNQQWQWGNNTNNGTNNSTNNGENETIVYDVVVNDGIIFVVSYI